MEAEVLQDVLEERVGNNSFVLLVVVVEAFLEVIKYVTWQIASIAPRVICYFGNVEGLLPGLLGLPLHI